MFWFLLGEQCLLPKTAVTAFQLLHSHSSPEYSEGEDDTYPVASRRSAWPSAPPGCPRRAGCTVEEEGVSRQVPGASDPGGGGASPREAVSLAWGAPNAVSAAESPTPPLSSHSGAPQPHQTLLSAPEPQSHFPTSRSGGRSLSSPSPLRSLRRCLLLPSPEPPAPPPPSLRTQAPVPLPHLPLRALRAPSLPVLRPLPASLRPTGLPSWRTGGGRTFSISSCMRLWKRRRLALSFCSSGPSSMSSLSMVRSEPRIGPSRRLSHYLAPTRTAGPGARHTQIGDFALPAFLSVFYWPARRSRALIGPFKQICIPPPGQSTPEFPATPQGACPAEGREGLR